MHLQQPMSQMFGCGSRATKSTDYLCALSPRPLPAHSPPHPPSHHRGGVAAIILPFHRPFQWGACGGASCEFDILKMSALECLVHGPNWRSAIAVCMRSFLHTWYIRFYADGLPTNGSWRAWIVGRVGAHGKSRQQLALLDWKPVRAGVEAQAQEQRAFRILGFSDLIYTVAPTLRGDYCSLAT